jgi:methyl-accepting chemotaxis protein
MVEEIAVASKEQSSGITQINQAISNIDQVTQQNAANAEESAAAAEEMSAQAKRINEVVQDLVMLVQGKENSSELNTKNSENSERRIVRFPKQQYEFPTLRRVSHP